MCKQAVLRISLFFTVWLVLFSSCIQAQAAVYPYVKVQGRQLMVDFDQDGLYEPFFIRGADYEPMPIGRHVSDWGWPAGYPVIENNIYNDDAILTRDFALLKAMNANTIRIWTANNTAQGTRFPNQMTAKTLQYAHDNNIKIIAGFYMPPAGGMMCTYSGPVYNSYQDFSSSVTRARYIYYFREFVKAFKNNPDILFWAIGNENNYSLEGASPAQVAAYYDLLNFMAAEVPVIEGVGRHPVAIVEGGIDFIGKKEYKTRDIDLPYINIWGSNVYRGKSFTDLFSKYKLLSAKPLWISEFGIDAFMGSDLAHPEIGVEDQKTQAEWDTALWDEIVQNRDVSIGGSVMEYSDEWWKPNEWNCEEENGICPAQVSTSAVKFYWDPREGASNYKVYVGTAFDSADIFTKTLGLVTEVVVPSIPFPVNSGLVYLKLTYVVNGKTVVEYAQYPVTLQPEAGEMNQIKVRRFASVHNTFGFGSVDTSCPADGIPEIIPPFPDKFYHEEWWGIVSIERNGYNADIVTPRQAYYALQGRFASSLPLISKGAPAGVVSAPASLLMVVETDMPAECRYDTLPGTPFSSMRYTFSVDGGKLHSQPLTGLNNNTSYAYYVRCQDIQDNINTADYGINFSVGSLSNLGDVSGDGLIQVFDALLVAKHAVGLEILTQAQVSRADVSRNGIVDVYDASLIARYAVGLITAF